MRLVLEAKYPHPFKETHDGDSYIIYETGKRTTDISKLQEKFDELVEETEGDGWSAEVSLDLDPKIKMVPVTKGTYPTEYNYDKKVLSSLRPSVADILNTARMIPDDKTRRQLHEMILMDPEWLSELCELVSK